MYKKIVLFLTCVIIVQSEDVYKKCGNRLQCIEKEMIKYIDKLDHEPSLSIFDSFLTVEKSKIENATAKTDENLIERCVRYLTTHELKIKIPSTSASNIVEARTRKLKRILLPLLLLLKLKAVIVVGIVLSAIGLIAFKGLGTGLIALTIAAATGLKNLLDSSGSKLTYEVVPQIAPPHWSRAGLETLPQAYHTLI